MKAKIAGAVAHDALEALTPHAAAMYATLGKRVVIIAELASSERTQVAADEEKDVSVTLQIKQLEVAAGELEDPVRKAMEALYTQRTAYGTLTEDQAVELSKTTLERVGNDINLAEAARLHAGLDKWIDYTRRARSSKLSAEGFRKELAVVADGLHTLLYPVVRPTLDGDGG